MHSLIDRFIRDARGATAIEYGLIVALISLVVIASVTATGKGLWNTMGNISTTLAR